MTDLLMDDLRIAARGLLRAPVLTLTALATLAIAMAGSTSVFALVDAVLLRSLPYAESGRLVALWVDYSARASEMGLQDPKREWTGFDGWNDVRSRAATLEDTVAFTAWSPTLSGSGEAERLVGASPTANAFEVLGAKPLLGRGFLPEDGAQGSADAIVLSHGLWQRQFGGDPAVLGTTVRLNRAPYTIVGVLPPGFRFPFLPEAEVFAALRPEAGDRGSAYLRQFGRLAPGATLAQAEQELDALAAALREQYPAEYRGMGLFVEPLQAALSNAVRPQLLVLQGAALMVLLIAAANIGSVMVARAQRRRGEFAVRTVLGGSSARRLRLLLVEAVLLALGGTVLGALLSTWGLQVFVAMFPQGFGSLWDVQLSLRAAGAAAVAALLVAAAIAVAAHLSLRRLRLTEAASTARRSVGSRPARRLSGALIATNFALALAVTVASLLLLDSHRRLQAVDLGYAPEGVLSGNVLLPEAGYADAAALRGAYTRIVDSLRGQPGIKAVGLSSSLPLGQNNNDTFVMVEGRPTTRADGLAHVWLNRIEEGFLPALGIQVLDGRNFGATDTAPEARRALVNAAFAKAYLHGESVLGRRIGFGPPENRSWFDVVGVVDDLRFFDVSAPQTPSVYLPLAVSTSRGLYVTVRTQGDALAATPALRAGLRAVDPALALSDLRAMEQRVDARLAVPRTVSRVTLLFAFCGLLLAGIGVYGTLANGVVQRIREFGVRRALGARDSSVLRLVVGQAFGPMLLGAALGIPLAWLLARQLQGVLYEVGVLSPMAWSASIGVLVAVAAVASALPWRSAVRVQPMAALRQE